MWWTVAASMRAAGTRRWPTVRNIVPESAFCQFSRTAGDVSLQMTDGEELQARLVIGAEGYKSTLGKQLGFPSPREFVRGIQVDLERRMEDQSYVDVWLGHELAPGFFAWRIPCEDRTRVGLCTSTGLPSDYLKRLLTLAGHDKDGRARLYSGMIPLGMLGRTVTDRVMLGRGRRGAGESPSAGAACIPD